MLLTKMPEGYNLQRYDDCGVLGRQPDVIHQRNCHTFEAAHVDADIKARTVTYGVPHFDMIFERLQAGVPYVLAVTYASEKNNKRVQSLFAGAVLLHGPLELPDGAAQRFLFNLPPSTVSDGRLNLHFTCNQGHNAVVSIVELWAPLLSPREIHLEVIPGVIGKLTGSVRDIASDGIPDAQVTIRKAHSTEVLGTLVTQADGSFEIDLSDWVKPGSQGTIEVIAIVGEMVDKRFVACSDLYFLPPQFRPIAKRVMGSESAEIKLDGVWRIHPSLAKDFHQHPLKPDDGHLTAATKNGWADFVVPGQWLQQGFNISRDEIAGIITTFGIPLSWADKRVFLRFDAIHGGTQYWLNGDYLGYSENLFMPVEFDVTDFVLPGEENRLALAMRVDTPSETASWSSNYAFHNLGGIDRSVRLFALPQVHIARFHYETLLDDEYKDAILSLNFTLENATETPVSELSIETKLEDPDGNDVWRREHNLPVGDIEPGQKQICQRLHVSNPLKWSAEKPHLYKLIVQLYKDDNLLEHLERSIGFRQVEVRGSQLWLNGKRIKLAGVNRHEIDPLSGRADTMQHAEVDVKLLRSANYNYIRTSHYPPTREFLDACDRFGVYVECEAPFCWTRGGRGEDNPSLTKHFLTAVAAMLEYYRDHPSVIIWSLANESGTGPDGENRLPQNFAATLDLCRKEDTSRPVIFSNEWNKDGGACDISVLHYASVNLTDNPWIKDDNRPVLINEYFPPQTFVFADELKLNPGLDVVNWSSGQNASSSHWSQIYKSDRLIGGAVWAGIDEEFYFPDGTVKGYGPWGFVDVWRRKKSLWWDAKRIHSPIWIPTRRVDYTPGQEPVQIPVENRYSFTDLGELSISWEVKGCGPDVLTSSGECNVNLPPQENNTIEVPIPPDIPSGSLLILRFFDSKGELVTAHGVILGDAQAASRPVSPCAGCPQWNDDGQVITVKGKRFQVKVIRTSGEMEQGDGELPLPLLGLPTLFVSRKEDKSPFNPNGLPYAQYPDESSRKIDAIMVKEDDSALLLTVEDQFKDFEGSLEILLDKEGCGSITFDYVYSGDTFTVSELGLRFLLEERCQEIRWRRQTEWDVYSEDHIGRPEGHALARIDQKWSLVRFPPYLSKPTWPWHLDENEYGTRDFRSAKYHIYEAVLVAPDGSGICVNSDGTTNVRANLIKGGVQFHTLLSSPPDRIAAGNRVSGMFSIKLLSAHLRFLGGNYASFPPSPPFEVPRKFMRLTLATETPEV